EGGGGLTNTKQSFFARIGALTAAFINPTALLCPWKVSINADLHLEGVESMASNVSGPEVGGLSPGCVMDAHQGLRTVFPGARSSKRPFICTVVRRILGMKMATCSQSSRTLYINIKSALDAALRPLAGVMAATTVRGGESAGTPVCPLCRCLMIRPVCLPCGHSLCKPCLARSTNNPLFCGSGRHRTDPVCARCPRCQQSWPVVPPGMEEDRRPTVVLQNAFIRWYPGWAECCKYREEGNRFAQEGNFALAVQYYHKALETGIPDHRVLSNRSRAYLAMEQLSEALVDTELCCKLKPTWPKGHFRRGAVLESLGRWEESLAAYFLCLHFSSGSTDVTPIICQIIDRHLPDRNCTSFSFELTSRVVEICRSRLAADCSSTTDFSEEEKDDKIPHHLLDQSDFECILCTGLLDKPVTVACGHSFCQHCLSRSFDHTPFCPVCRSPLAEVSIYQYHCN
ncbi:LON peptidase N-terminal domain and RING finger protein 3, partial [Geodia barretti]